MKETILVSLVMGLAMLIARLGTAIQNAEERYRREQNEEFNARLIEEVKMQRGTP